MVREPQFEPSQGRQTVRILLLEDDPISVEIVGTYLRRVTFAQSELRSIATLSEALALLADAAADLVISDLHLPDSTGAATIKALVGVAGCPVIAITSDLNPFLRDATLACGAYDFLQKADLTEATLSRLVRLAAMQAATFHSLRESEERFRSLSALSSDMYWEQDAEYRFTGFSVSALDRIQTDRLVGKRRWEQKYFNMGEADWAAHRAVLEARQPFRDLELGRVNEAGEKVWVSVSGAPFFDDAGRFAGYRGVGKDITARKRDEHLLQLEHTVTRCLAEADSASAALKAVMHAICETEQWECGRYFRRDDEGGAFCFREFWNVPVEAIDRFVEWSRDKSYAPGVGLVGRVGESGEPLWIPNVSADSRVAHKALAAEHGMRGAFIFPVKSQGTTIGALAFNSREIREPDERLLKAVRVIGSQVGQFLQRKQAEVVVRRSEERFRSLTELSSDFYWESDSEHRLVPTQQASTHRPVVPGVQRFGRRRWELASTRPDAAAWAAHRATMEAHQPFRDFEFARVDDDGVERHLSISGEPMFDAAGRFSGYRGVGKDITGRKRAELLLELEHTVTRCLSGAADAPEALKSVMRAICEANGWECGRYFRRGEDDVFRFAEAWYLPSPENERFVAYSAERSFAVGVGIVGRAGAGEPQWVADVGKDSRVVHAMMANEHRMRGAFMFPVMAQGRALGVLSFTSREIREPDQRLLAAVRVIGSQVGQFVQRRHAESQRQEIEVQFRRTFELAGTGLAHVGLDRRFIRVNRRLCELFGYPETELLGRAAKELSHPDDDVDVTSGQRLRLYSGESDALRGEKRYLRRDGSVVWLAYTVAVERDAQGNPLYEIAAFDDVTDRKRAEQRQAAHLRYQEHIARFGQAALAEREPAELIDKAVQAVLEALTADAVAYLEPEPGAEGLVLHALVGVADPGAPPGTIACPDGSPLARVIHSGSRVMAGGGSLPLAWARELGSAALVPVRGDNKARGVLYVGYRPAGAFAAEQLNFIDAAASVLSSALQRIDSESRLAYLAQFDPLTGLPNRALLADRFSQMIVQAKRRGALLAVLFIDLDGFKTVNDTLGHAGGDALLKEVAARLQATVRGGDTVARISGDEFAVVLGDLARTEDAALVAQKVINRLADTVDIGGKEVFVTASVGIASFPGDGADADTLIGAADAAMYRAKQAGRNAYQFFTVEINQRSRARAHMGAELRRALEREEFTLFYQPKVDLASRRTTGAEALLRWKHPERGLVSPAEFIPVLEETGLIVPVGDWVLQRACKDLKAWDLAGLALPPVAVNLSARQFRRTDLDSHFKALVTKVGVDPGLIELEITESQLMQDPAHAIRVMHALRDAGMRIAIDDFGTGYSSLAYLNRFPVSALKIDRSFVKDMAKDKDAATIVRTIIEMAHSLGFTVVAEGVETEEQATFLRLLRCGQAQGYLFAKPMPREGFVKALEKR